MLALAFATYTTALAEVPTAPAPIATIEFPGDSSEVPLSEAFPGVDTSQAYDLDILTKDGESYATRMATLYATIEPLCHVATLSPSQAIVESCSKKPAEQVTGWRSFVASLLQGKPSNTKPSNRPEGKSDIYLIDSGKTLTLVTRQSLEGVVLNKGSFPPALSVSFDPPCKFPTKPSGAKVVTLCKGSLPLPPFTASIEGDTLELKRLHKEATQALISLTQRPDATGAVQAQQESQPRRVVVNLYAGDAFCEAYKKKYKHAASLNTLFRSPQVPFGSQCEKVALTCKAGKWVTSGESEVDISQLSRSCKVDKPKSCTIGGKTVAHGGTLPLFKASEAPVGERCQRLIRRCENGVMSGDDSFRSLTCGDTKACTFNGTVIKDKGKISTYQLNFVDSSAGRKCSAPENMLTRTCANGKLSDSPDWRSFPHVSCTERAMPKCDVNGTRLTHGDTREVFTSATVPAGSSCDSVKKIAQCVAGRMMVDGAVVLHGGSWQPPYVAECKPNTQGSPGGGGGSSPPASNDGRDGDCPMKEELPDCDDRDCCSQPSCSGTETCLNNDNQQEYEICSDGLDNDKDGHTDCEDWMDCARDHHCNQSEQGPKCFVCVYGEDNEGEEGYLKGHCTTLWKEAEAAGAERKILISAEDFPVGLEAVKSCHPDIRIELLSHGRPGEEDAFVSAWEEVVDVAPQCTMGDMQIRVTNCSNFAVSGGVIRNARQVAKKYAQRGYTGTLKVTGNQYMTAYKVRTSSWLRSRINTTWGALTFIDPNTGEERRTFIGEAILFPFRIVGTVKLPFSAVKAKIREARYPPDSINSWLQVAICSEGVESVLPPCKEAGDIVMVDLSTNVAQGAVTIAACSHNGRRANQDCAPMLFGHDGPTPCEILPPVLCTN
jgi:hypothetical protein